MSDQLAKMNGGGDHYAAQYRLEAGAEPCQMVGNGCQWLCALVPDPNRHELYRFLVRGRSTCPDFRL